MSDFKVSRGTLGRYKIGDDDFIWTQLENEDDAERVCELVNGLNAEITRLHAELERVRGQRDRLAVDVHDTAGILMRAGGRVRPNHGADETLAKYSLRIVGGKVEEIEK